MAKGKLRICYVDKTQYNYCRKCSSDPTWKFVYCCENCRDIKYLLDAYEAKAISANEANKRLDELDLSNLDNFADYIKEEIAEIRANSTTKKSTKSKKEESNGETPQDEPSGDSE